jgi:serine/threonine protein kinase
MKLMTKSEYFHPNLQTLESIFEEDDFLYTVEKPLAISLSMRLEILLESKDTIILKVRQILTWFVSLCEAVDYLHSNNIIHGNICCGMIGFDENDTIKLKLTDFDLNFVINNHLV